MTLDQHPSVRKYKEAARAAPPAAPLDAAWLREECLALGADDVGFVALDRPELDDQRDEILSALPGVQALVSFVVKMNHGPIRSPARSVSNLEFHHSGDRVNEVARDVVRLLQDRGIPALNPSMGFPMEMDRFPGKLWVVAHKPVAVAAGLGQMGIHRNVIHPRFGNFILLGTIVVGAEISESSQPIDYNPCLECKLCVAACPVGAIAPDGRFDFSACYTHNYREFMGGFTDWVETVADSDGAGAYRERVADSESASIWQSLSYGANYKSAYCISVCPAGDDVIGPFLDDKSAHVATHVKPLQAKLEPVFVVRGSDAEAHVQKRYPHKRVRHVHSSLRASTLDQFLFGLPLIFQRGPALGLDLTIHFTFSGAASEHATVVIRDQRVEVTRGEHVGDAQLAVKADTETWLAFLKGDRNLAVALLARKIRLRGSPKHLLAFGRCFPR